MPKELIPFTFMYRNHRGEVAERHVIPISPHWGSTEWHPEPQWLLQAYDLDKAAIRDFAMDDILGASLGQEIPKGWTPHTPGDMDHIARLPDQHVRVMILQKDGEYDVGLVGDYDWRGGHQDGLDIIAWRRV